MKKLKRLLRFIKRILAFLGGILLTGLLLVLGINAYVCAYASQYILDEATAAALPDLDCALVLGCAVYGNNKPSPMLEDRLARGVGLYEAGLPKIIVSGDHGTLNYDEVSVMRDYCLEKGVPAEHIFLDHAGFSTYESMFRARDVFEVKKMVVVTQKYHLYRAVYTARQLGMEAYGVGSDQREYQGQLYRDTREVLARVKDFFMVMFELSPTHLGSTIPVSGIGNATA